MCCNSWGHKESDTTERLNLTEGKRLKLKPPPLPQGHGPLSGPLCLRHTFDGTAQSLSSDYTLGYKGTFWKENSLKGEGLLAAQRTKGKVLGGEGSLGTRGRHPAGRNCFCFRLIQGAAHQGLDPGTHHGCSKQHLGLCVVWKCVHQFGGK